MHLPLTAPISSVSSLLLPRTPLQNPSPEPLLWVATNAALHQVLARAPSALPICRLARGWLIGEDRLLPRQLEGGIGGVR
jgi:hypothetical protein